MKSVYPGIYTYQRMVRYSDCDASHNYFTPRAADYAVEAVEGWFEYVLGVSWVELLSRHEYVVHVMRAECEFHKALTAGDLVEASVIISAVDATQIRFIISGDKHAELCFLVHLAVCFARPGLSEALPIPPEYEELLVGYQLQCGVIAEAKKNSVNGKNGVKVVPFQVTSDCGQAPFVYRRRIVFGECTASGTVYPPRVFEYLLEAAGAWYELFLGISWMEQNIHKIGQPFLNVTCDYIRPIFAGQLISIMVTIARLGRTSLVYSAVGRDEQDCVCFEAQLAACYCFHVNGALKPSPFPAAIRKKIMAYRTACDECDFTRPCAE